MWAPAGRTKGGARTPSAPPLGTSLAALTQRLQGHSSQHHHSQHERRRHGNGCRRHKPLCSTYDAYPAAAAGRLAELSPVRLTADCDVIGRLSPAGPSESGTGCRPGSVTVTGSLGQERLLGAANWGHKNASTCLSVGVQMSHIKSLLWSKDGYSISFMYNHQKRLLRTLTNRVLYPHLPYTCFTLRAKCVHTYCRWHLCDTLSLPRQY